MTRRHRPPDQGIEIGEKEETTIQHLALELAQQQGDDHDEGEAGEASQHDEDGLLQPAGPVRARGADVDKVIVLIEIWRNIVCNRIMV